MNIVGLCVGIHCYFVHFDDAHKLSFFSTQQQTHGESPLLLSIQYGTKRRMYVCWFLYLVHLLYHEIGLK